MVRVKYPESWGWRCLRHCARCGAGNLTNQRHGLVSVRAVSIMQSANASFDSEFTDSVVAVTQRRQSSYTHKSRSRSTGSTWAS